MSRNITKKIIISSILGLSLLVTTPSVVSASADSTQVSVRKKSIVKKYRTYNGRLQYRRWDEANRVWVDSKWIDIK